EVMREADVDRAEAAADRGRDRPLEGDAVRADRVEHVLGKWVAAVLVHDVRAGLLDVPVEFDTCRLENAACRLGQLGPGAVAWDQGDSVRHGRQPSRGGEPLRA